MSGGCGEKERGKETTFQCEATTLKFHDEAVNLTRLNLSSISDLLWDERGDTQLLPLCSRVALALDSDHVDPQQAVE